MSENNKYRDTDKGKAKRREQNKKYYETHKSYFSEYLKERRKNKDIANAYITFQNAVRSGKIIRPEICGACKKPGIIQAHHDDYTKPLEVKWLCAKCHSRAHHAVIAA